MAIPNIDSMTPEQARAYMSSLAPTTSGTTGDYSDIDSFRSYTFSDPNYQFEDFRQLAEIAGYGKEDELASATNISSGAGPDTFRIADPLDMGTNTGALSNLDPSSNRKPFPTAGENLTDEEYQQNIKDIYNNAGLPAPGEPGYNPLISPPLIDLPEDYVPPEINPLTGQPNVSQLNAMDSNVQQSNAMDSNAPEPVAQDLGEDGSPQPPEPYKSDPFYLKSDHGSSLKNVGVVGVEGYIYTPSSSFIYLKDRKTGKTYTYDDNMGKSEETGYIGSPPPPDADLLITSINRKVGDDFRNTGDISEYGFTFGGVTDPTTLQSYIQQANREPGYEKGGGGLFYEYKGRSYYTPDNSGSSIPVGSTGITRDPTQLGQYDSEGNYTKFDSSTYTSPVLDKTFEGYVASGDVRDGVTTYTSKGPPSARGKTMPPATDSFLESIGTNTPYNIGKALGLGDFILSSPPSNRFNLQPFFNQAESQGMDNFLRSQQRDVLQLIKDGNFFTALAGKPPGASLLSPNTPGQFATDPLQIYDSLYDIELGQKGLNEVLSQLQGLDDNDPTTGIDPSFQLDVFDTDSDSQVASVTGDDEGTDADPDGDEDSETPEDTDPFVVRAYQGGGVGPFASNYIFQRFGYRPTETIDMLLRYDPVEELYFFENGQPVDPEFLQNMQLTKLDDEGQVVKDDEGKPVRMPKVVIEDDATTDEEEE